MSDQRYSSGSSPRSGRRSYQSYEDRYTFSTRQSASRNAYEEEFPPAAGANNPRVARNSTNNPRNASNSGRVRVEHRTGSSNNPRAWAEAKATGSYAPVNVAAMTDDDFATPAEPASARREARARTRTPRTSGRPSANAGVRPSAAGPTVRPLGGASAGGAGGGRYGSDRYSSQRNRNPISKVLVAMVVIALLGAGFGIYNIVNPAQFEVTINGMTKTVERGTTIDDMINTGVVSPVAGDLVAVDGSIITQGGGDRFNAILNEEETIDGTKKLRKDDVIQVSDGKDIMEEYSVEEVTVDPGQAVDGIGSIHHYVDGVVGKTEVRTGATSGLTVETVITPVSDAMFKSYNADTGADKAIALTFDDGPWPTTTDQVLDILKQYGVKATFFTIGEQIDDYPEATKRIVDEGHQLCTHTWDHAAGSGQGVNLTYMSAEEQIAEVTKGYDAIKAITGTEASHIIRAPGGNYSGDIVWTLEPYVDAEIGWNVDTMDWSRPGADAIAQAILSAEPGDVVLMHDGGGDRSQTVEALRIAIPKLIERGYTFVTMDELIAYNDPASMEPGTWN